MRKSTKHIAVASSARARFCLAVSAIALISVPAAAQTAPAEVAAEGEIVVTGSRPIAESEAAALLIQRNSDSLITVAAADAVGRLPDQNIAQAAGRLPGVSVERDQGQARYINLRGAPKTWTTLSFDGINVVSPEGRDSRYDSIPSAIASQIIIAKAVTPDMPGETIAGNVNIVTRSAFDYKGFHLGGKLGAGYAELGKRGEWEGSLVLSNTYDLGSAGEFGMVISGSYYERNMLTDNFETDWEVPLSTATATLNQRQDQRPGFEGRYWARETENKLYRLTRRNWSLSSRFDWKPDADNTISLRSLYTIFTDDELRDNYIVDLDDRQADLGVQTAACPTTTAPVTTSGYADICTGSNTPLLGTIYGIDINQRSTLRAYKQSIWTNTLAGDHKFGEGWQLKWQGNYTRSIDDRSVVGEARYDSPSTRNLRPTVSYNLTNPGFNFYQLFTTVQTGTVFSAGPRVTDIDSFTKPMSSIRTLDAVDTTEAYTGKIDLSKRTDLFGGDTIFRVGFQYDRRTKTADERQILLDTPALLAGAGIDTNFLNNAENPGTYKGAIPLGYTFHYYSEAAMRANVARARAFRAPTSVDANNYKVTEEILSGYVMGTAKFDWGSIVGGVRVERVKNTGQAIATIGTTTGLVTASSSSTMFFPSLHFNYNIDDTKKLRIGFTSGAARADYDQLRPNVVVNDANLTISGGNPAIKPERAYGVDAYLEWYVQPQGYFMLGAFYKRVDDVLFNSRRTFGSDALNTGTTDRSGYIYSGIVNGGSGYLYGMEAAAQMQLEPYTAKLGLPDWMGGFGINANVTLNQSEVEKPAIAGPTAFLSPAARKVRLPGTSDVIYNIGVYYEKYGFSARLNYQLRTDWLDTVSDTLVDAGDTYWALDTEMDLSLRYEVKKGFEIYFDASNLLNQPGRRYSDAWTAKNTPYTIEWERFGRRYTGGVRITL